MTTIEHTVNNSALSSEQNPTNLSNISTIENVTHSLTKRFKTDHFAMNSQMYSPKPAQQQQHSSMTNLNFKKSYIVS